jgi:hypothetical protein
MLFPFASCEVKRGAAGLDIADRQNAHTMTLAVRGIVEIFKLAGREKELHRQVQTFSICHDNRSVRMYGYYPEFDGPTTKIYRHQIHSFDITARNGKERWTAYKFTAAVYHHSLTLLEKIRSIVDNLPDDFDFESSLEAEPRQAKPSMLSPIIENQATPDELNLQPSQFDSQQNPPDSSIQDGPASKKKNRKRKTV